jgi:Flp pilus assembly secretin CpaC
MKRNWMLVGLAVGGLGLAGVTHGQEPAPPAFEKAAGDSQEAETADGFDPDINAPRQVQVQVEFVEMSHEALTKLLFLAKPASADATKLREKVQEMVAKNEAKVLETQITVAKSGQKATTDAIHEFIYPTEYTPPMTEEELKKRISENISKFGSLPYNPSIPTGFDTRNVGSTLEIEPTIGVDNKLIDLRFAPELIWHTGNTVWHEGKDSAGNPFKHSMPDIYAVRLNTSLTCANGQYTLAGVTSPKDDKGEVDMTRKVMIFVKCDVLVVK